MTKGTGMALEAPRKQTAGRGTESDTASVPLIVCRRPGISPFSVTFSATC